MAIEAKHVQSDQAAKIRFLRSKAVSLDSLTVDSVVVDAGIGKP